MQWVTALTNRLGLNGIEVQSLEDADVFLRNTAKNYPTRGPAEAPLTGHLSTPSFRDTFVDTVPWIDV